MDTTSSVTQQCFSQLPTDLILSHIADFIYLRENDFNSLNQLPHLFSWDDNLQASDGCNVGLITDRVTIHRLFRNFQFCFTTARAQTSKGTVSNSGGNVIRRHHLKETSRKNRTSGDDEDEYDYDFGSCQPEKDCVVGRLGEKEKDDRSTAAAAVKKTNYFLLEDVSLYENSDDEDDDVAIGVNSKLHRTMFLFNMLMNQITGAQKEQQDNGEFFKYHITIQFEDVSAFLFFIRNSVLTRESDNDLLLFDEDGALKMTPMHERIESMIVLDVSFGYYRPTDMNKFFVAMMPSDEMEELSAYERRFVSFLSYVRSLQVLTGWLVDYSMRLSLKFSKHLKRLDYVEFYNRNFKMHEMLSCAQSSNVNAIRFRDPDLEEIQDILQYKSLQSLTISFIDQTFDLWNETCHSTNLSSLCITHCKLSGSMLESILGAFPALKQLKIHAKHEKQSSLHKPKPLHKFDALHLCKCPQLSVLSLKNVMLSESFCKELAKMSNITQLTLGNCNLSDAHLTPLLESTTLESLDVRGNKKLCTARLIARNPFDKTTQFRMNILYNKAAT